MSRLLATIAMCLGLAPAAVSAGEDAIVRAMNESDAGDELERRPDWMPIEPVELKAAWPALSCR